MISLFILVLYCLGNHEIYPDLVFLSRLILGIVFKDDVKDVNIISGIERANKKLEVKVWWDLF